ncbi:MAG: hypothetical protein QOI13_1329 [Paraburkholderia sp.]|jgi:hypothetical protein|nr:hypothetical protein [Paraburkholderia sp.]
MLEQRLADERRELHRLAYRDGLTGLFPAKMTMGATWSRPQTGRFTRPNGTRAAGADEVGRGV